MVTINDSNAPYIRAAKHLSSDKLLPEDTLKKLTIDYERPKDFTPVQMHTVENEVQTLAGCCKALSHIMPDMIDFHIPVGKPENKARLQASTQEAGYALVGMRMIANVLPQFADGSKRPDSETKEFLKQAVSQKDKIGLFVTPVRHLKTVAFVLRHAPDVMKNQSKEGYQLIADKMYSQLHPGAFPNPEKAFDEFPKNCERLATQYDFTVECLEKMQKAYNEQMGKAIESARSR